MPPCPLDPPGMQSHQVVLLTLVCMVADKLYYNQMQQVLLIDCEQKRSSHCCHAACHKAAQGADA